MIAILISLKLFVTTFILIKLLIELIVSLSSILFNKPLIVNGIPIDKPLDTDKVDWANLAKGTPSSFHGDLHFENILYDGHQFNF